MVRQWLSTLIPRPLSTFLPLSRFLCSAAATSSHFYNLLRSNDSRPNLERALLRYSYSAELNSSIVQSVISKFPLSSAATEDDGLLALRFFVWAGLQPNHRHSAAAYAAAAATLDISRHPHSLSRLLSAYLSDGSPVTLKTFKILLALCRAASLPDQALSLLRRTPDFGCLPDTPAFNTVLRLLVDHGRVEDCGPLLEEMTVSGLRPDMVTYSSVLRGLCRAGLLDPARTLVDRMWSNGCVPNTVIYSILVEGACGCGHLDAAMEILREMESGADGNMCAPNVVTYTCLIKCLCEKGRAAEAVGVVDRMGLRGCLPNRVTIAVLIDGLCSEGRVDDAFELVERVVQERSISSEDSYSSLVLGLLRVERREEAEGLLERMLALGVRPSGSACNAVMRELCSQGRVLDGYFWFGKLEEKGVTCIDLDVYSLLFEGLCEQGYMAEAVFVGRKIVERGVRLETSCINGMVEALETIDEGKLASKIMRLSIDRSTW